MSNQVARHPTALRPRRALTEYLRIDEAKGRFEVDKRAFTDEEVFRKERDLIFSKCWLYIGHESEIKNPRDFVTRKVGGRNLIFNRDRKGEVHAFYNVCTHRGSMLEVKTSGTQNVFTCPYHGWVFDGEGTLRDQADPVGGYDECFNEDGRYNLNSVPRLENYRGWYFVNFNPKAVDLPTYLGGTKEYLDLIADQSEAGMEVIGGSQHLVNGGNWKLLTDNLTDVYHGFVLHSTYFEFVLSRTKNPKTNDTLFQGFAGGLGNGHNVWENSYAVGRPIAFWIPAFGEETKPIIEKKKQELVERFGQERADRIATTSRNLSIFPNMVIVDNVGISIRTMYPETTGSLSMNIWAMAPADEPANLRNVRLDNHLTFTGPAGFAHPDDYEIFERIREGSENSPEMWFDYSKGMSKVEEGADFLTARGNIFDEAQQRAWWSQWDRIIAGAETLE